MSVQTDWWDIITSKEQRRLTYSVQNVVTLVSLQTYKRYQQPMSAYHQWLSIFIYFLFHETNMTIKISHNDTIVFSGIY